MKIGGPKGPAPPIEPPKSTETERPEKSGAARFDQLLGARGSPRPESAAPPSGVIAEVSARLQAGEVTRDQAVELLIDAVIESKALELTPGIRDKLRDALRGLVSEDPVLAEKVRKLGGEG
jgi:hypothetical protein